MIERRPVIRGSDERLYRFITSVQDFPPAVSGVITLADNATYVIVGTVDLKGLRLVAGQNTTILGGSSENCRLKSTGLSGTALITSNWSIPIRGITIEANVALNLDATGNANQAIDWFGVNFTDCATVGTIKSYGNVIWSDCALLNSESLSFDGTIGTVGFSQCIFSTSGTGKLINVPATATITRRFRVIYSAFVVSDEFATGIDVNTSATFPVEGYILDTVNFSGLGTYVAGVQHSDNKALFVNCRGVSNSSSVGFMTMQNNATATTVASSGVAYKAAGTTTLEALSEKFSHSNNRLTYSGAIRRDFRVLVNCTLTSTNGNVLGLYIAKNGTVITNSEQYITANAAGKAEGGSCQTVVELATNDYIEFFVENSSAANDITVEFLSMIVEAIN